MFEKGLESLASMSQAAGQDPAYVQGGGGNTSVKLDDRHMAVKASGFKLNQMTTTSGFVVVDYLAIRDYYNQVDLDQDVDFEKESVAVAKGSVIELPGIETLRPSVEAGFHAILNRYVLHTHPVYANLLCCSYDGEAMMHRIFDDKDYGCVYIPYINPGFCLTLKIKAAFEAYEQAHGKQPEVIFMENHGLVVTSDDYDRTLELHEDVNQTIKAALNIKEAFPTIKLASVGDNTYMSETAYLKQQLKAMKPTLEALNEKALYPDQLVYLNKSISFDGTKNKVMADVQTGMVVYHTSEAEAMTIEETFLAYLYVLDQIEIAKLPLKVMSATEIDFINNWESEAYRKSLVKRM